MSNNMRCFPLTLTLCSFSLSDAVSQKLSRSPQPGAEPQEIRDFRKRVIHVRVNMLYLVIFLTYFTCDAALCMWKRRNSALS